MDNKYTELKEIQRKYRNELAFNMAVSVLMDEGFKNVEKWTAEDIAEAEVLPMMTEEFFKQILIIAREIAKTTTPVDLILFCMTECSLDTKFFSNKLSYNDLEKMIKRRIPNEKNTFKSNEEIDLLCEMYGCDAEYFEMLGYEIPESYWEE